MYRAEVTNNGSFEIEPLKEGFKVNGEPVSWDLARISDQYFHILQGGRSYRAEVIKADYKAKAFVLKVNGHKYTISLKDKFDQLLEKMGMNTAASSKVNSIKAPMPGLIIDLKVKDGDTVKAGDPLLVLEAMKMENIIKSPGEGTVKSIKISKGDSVEKNQVLIEF